MDVNEPRAESEPAEPGGAVPAIAAEEERLLARVRESLARATAATRTRGTARVGAPAITARARADAELIALRDEIGEARLEDVAALVAQMERLQGISLRRAEAQSVLVDPGSPYFGHLRVREAVEGRAPIERDVCIGRATFVDPAARVNIVDWRDAPISQLYYRYEEGSDFEELFGARTVEGEVLARRTLTIEGGRLLRVAAPQGVWTRQPDGGGWLRADVPHPALAGGEGTAMRPGGARGGGVLGAGPTRAQRLDRRLPEIAALIDPRQFEIITGKRSGVVAIQGGAGSGKTTVGLHRIAYLAYAYPERFPARKTLVVTYGSALAAYIGQVLPALGVPGVEVLTFQQWAEKALRRAIPWLRPTVVEDAPPVVTRVKSHPSLLRLLETRAREGKPRTSRAVVELWAELLTDRPALLAAIGGDVEAPLPAADVEEALRLMSERVAAVVAAGEPREKSDPRDGSPDDDDVRGDIGIDGVRVEDERPIVDLLDMAILLRAHQLLRGSKHPLAHLFVDEAQDLSPMELAVLINETTAQRSVTLAGDTAQRLFLDNGFGDWRSVLRQLDLSGGAVAVEPLRIAYRSTREIMDVARFAMGPLAAGGRLGESPAAPRHGAPVEAHRFPGTGAAVAFLAEALRPLFQNEPRATVAVLSRHPEQADRYYEGLRRAEIPSLRRVRAQDFAFRPGIDVSEIRQAKGLEFDYVVLVDVNASTFGTDDESRHLFHIGATRAAHQLWLIVTATPSRLLPPGLRPD
ncbi:MAG TPA: 3'-5' exonuclease [Polyangia bacterium]|nr:3'-5' exonuclease [Polyangia bacterium]